MRPTFPPKALKLGGLALAVLVAGSGLVLALRDDPEPAAQVRLAAAKRGVVTASITAAGNTVDGSRRDLGFGGSGTVTKIYVKVGAKVKKGQVLARVNSTAAREDYTAAAADLAAAEEALNTASTAATSTATCSPSSGGTTGGTSASVVGAVAAKGAFGPSAVPVADAAPTTTLTPATTPTPRPTWTPTPEPTPSGHEPQPTVTVTVTATATVTATVTATPEGGRPSASPTGTSTAKPSAKPTGKSSAKPTGKATGKPTGKATGKPTGKPSTGASGRPSGKATPGTRQSQGGSPCSGANGKGGISEDQASANVDRAQAALEQAADEVRGTRIVAPASGTVLSVAGSVGDTAGTSTFISLGDLNELQVDAMVTESDVNKLKLGQEANITLATRGSEKYAGKVTRIAPTATVSDKLVRYSVTLAFDKPPRGLMLGQTASVSVTTGTANDGIYVPAEAVKSRSDGTTVVTVRSGGHDSARVVRTGVRGDQYVEITSGLSESDQVVMAGSTTGEFPDTSWPES
ncbi:efflux RND transporter periplasmic adaptor subunit [Nonomuraea sp. NEAU-A123]|uniref:efflux RND transporter periplasmic adaptor subunit n=1 Tax=Nonomuraea sp. NEAU-A123 TaxID=2839649 RepID=UPI001BE43E0F|nr:efflux RND transporter periplasmic adaptor subunit [Nonomuraea sp. NEAU-A123]MBT2233018.1 efflux RND transporter periplasmic adaptor subunit [Nonomuraea sp. NEAU-A123]